MRKKKDKYDAMADPEVVRRVGTWDFGSVRRHWKVLRYLNDLSSTIADKDHLTTADRRLLESEGSKSRMRGLIGNRDYLDRTLSELEANGHVERKEYRTKEGRLTLCTHKITPSGKEYLLEIQPYMAEIGRIWLRARG